MKLRNLQIGLTCAAVATLSLTLPCLSSMAGAAEKAPKAAVAKKGSIAPVLLEAWPGQRVVMLLPLQMGAATNISAEYSRAILPSLMQSLRGALQATGKFSVIEPYRFNPILLRGIQEGRISRTEVLALTETPTLENARAVMAKLDPTFDQGTFIGQFSVEDVRFSGSGKQARAQVQVSGNLYEVAGVTATNPTVVTSDPFGGSNTMTMIISSANSAFKSLAAEFTKPLADPFVTADVAVVTPVIVPDGTPATNPVPPVTPVPDVIVVDEVPVPGDGAPQVPATPGTRPTGGARDIVPQLPAAQPPLDINVPNNR